MFDPGGCSSAAVVTPSETAAVPLLHASKGAVITHFRENLHNTASVATPRSNAVIASSGALSTPLDLVAPVAVSRKRSPRTSNHHFSARYSPKYQVVPGMQRFPVYPSVFVQADWHEMLADPDAGALARTFWVSLIRNCPVTPSLHYTFSMPKNCLQGGPDYEATMIDSRRCHIHLLEDSRRVDESYAPLYSSFVIVAPFASFIPLRNALVASELISTSSSASFSGPDDLTAVDVRDGTLFACGYCDGTVLLVENTPSAQSTLTLHGHTERVTRVRFFPTGRYLLTASEDSTARVWDLEEFSCVQVLTGHDAGITDCAVLAQGLAVATCSLDGTARVWEWSKGKCMRVISVGEEINSLAILNMDLYDAELINAQANETTASADAERSLATFACESGRVVAYHLGLWKSSENPLFEVYYPSRVNALAFLCPELLAAGYESGTVIIWNVRVGHPARSVEISGGEVSHLIRVRDTHLVVATAGGCLSVLRTNAMEGLPLDIVLTGNDGILIRDVAYSATKDVLTTCGRDGTIKQYWPR